MKKEQFQEKNPPFDLYLNGADFDFTKIDGIDKEVIVKRLGLQNEEYVGYTPSTAYSERKSFDYRYRMPKNSQTPYETSIQMVFWDEGRQAGEDRKTRLPLFKGATELKSISISRFK